MTVTTRSTTSLAHDLIDIAIHEGGGTFSTTIGDFVVPDRGFAVSGGFPGLVLTYSEFEEATVADWIAELPTVEYIGCWAHEGKIYIDVTDIIANRAYALALAKHRNELAVYDFATGDVITL